MHRLIAADAMGHPGPEKMIVYLGDYVDRGMESRQVVDVLLNEKLPGFEHKYLKGNHEEVLLRFLADEACGPGWFTFGGDATLFSYGVRPPAMSGDRDELRRAQRQFAENLPPAHLDFFRDLALSHSEGDYHFVHAGIRPGVALDHQIAEDLLWIREEFLHSDADFGKVVVHGHSITEKPEIRANRIGVDTGAFASGRLTCVVLEGTSRSFIAT